MPAITRKRPLTARLQHRAAPVLPSNALTRFLLSSGSVILGPRPATLLRTASPCPTNLQPAAVTARIGPPVLASPGLSSASPAGASEYGADSLCSLPAETDRQQPLRHPVSPHHVEEAAILEVGTRQPLSFPAPPPVVEDPPHSLYWCPETVSCRSGPPPARVTLWDPITDTPYCDISASGDSPFSRRPSGPTMPPKSQRPSASQKKQLATPSHKRPPWSDPPEGDRASTPPLTQQPPQEDNWGPSSDSHSEGSDNEGAHPRGDRRWVRFLSRLPTKEDFKVLVAEVKEACKVEIAAVRQDLRHVSERVDSLETEHDLTRRYISQLQTHVSSQEALLQDTQLHIEDLDNRGRRNNIRVRGLPEAEGAEDLQTTLESIFNKLLNDSATGKILMDRAHRALRPKKLNGPPRDVICRVQDFALKEKIMLAARNQREIKHEGSVIQLYPDLAWATLQRRRQLQPLLALLRTRAIAYRWGFPFSLTASLDGKSSTLRSPTDLPAFCSSLGIDQPSLPDWEKGSLPHAPPPIWHSAQQKRRRPSPRGSSCSALGHPSPTAT